MDERVRLFDSDCQPFYVLIFANLRRIAIWMDNQNKWQFAEMESVAKTTDYLLYV